ncbi:MAG TPA: M24 family metallopeptidase, partial [Gaiellales bacterium]|nr:M24 family metallopeptidase [Gaiellales bacterium]
MPGAVLIHADSLRDRDLFFSTGISVVDPFTYIEQDGRRIVVVSVLEVDAARRDSPADDVWTTDEFDPIGLVRSGMSPDAVEMEVVRRALARAGVSSVSVPPAFPLALADFLRASGVELRPDPELFVARRRAKDDQAVAGIRVAQRATEAAFATIREMIGAAGPGAGGLVFEGEPLTCERLRAAVEDTLREHGCETDPPIIAAGPQSALGHEPGSGPVRPGEPLVCDIFPRDRRSRLHADMTRTFCFGPAPDWLRQMHAAVLEALQRSTDVIAPGVRGRAVWEVAC